MGARRRDDVINTLRQRFLSASHLGLLAPGDKLPSARDLARELGVDRRVVLVAYRELEREGVIELRQRSGIYFAPAAAGARGDGRRADWVVEVFAEAVARGTPARALGDALDRYVSTLRLRAACVECNADQIAALCAELTTDFGVESTGAELDALDPAGVPTEVIAAVRRADLLVTTPFHAGEVKAIAERLGKPWIVASLKADVFAEIARRLAAGPAFAVVADPRFARKLGLVYASTVGARNFRALVVGRDDLGVIPPGAPCYVTRLARERLDGHPLPGLAIAEPRAFSTESTREVLAFIVRANMAALNARLGGLSGSR